jgi:hypothetical protein
MTSTLRCAAVCAATLLVVAAHDVGARGGGRGGGGRVGGGRAGGGFAGGGAAAGGSFGQGQVGAGVQGGGYNGRGPAASGRFPGRSGGGYAAAGAGDWQAERQERVEQRREQYPQNAPREDWQDYDASRREDWQDYAEDHYDDHVGDVDHPYAAAVAVGAGAAAVATVAAAPPYWTLPCTPETVVVGGTTYYHCGSAWYVRVYSDGDVSYSMTNPPAGY